MLQCLLLALASKPLPLACEACEVRQLLWLGKDLPLLAMVALLLLLLASKAETEMKREVLEDLLSASYLACRECGGV